MANQLKFLIILLLFSCKNQKIDGILLAPVTTDMLSKDAVDADSISFYKVYIEILENPAEMGIMVSLSDDDQLMLEERTEPMLENAKDDVTIIILDNKIFADFDNIKQYESLYFYAGESNIGKLQKVKRIEYHVTPMGAYVIAVFDSLETKGVYASNRPELEIECWLKEDNKNSPIITSFNKQDTDVEIFHFSCESKGYHLVQINSESQSEIYFYKDEEKLKLVYQSNILFIDEVIILPVFRNNVPLIFASIGDLIYDGVKEVLMAFDGNTYVVAKGDKILEYIK